MGLLTGPSDRWWWLAVNGLKGTPRQSQGFASRGGIARERLTYLARLSSLSSLSSLPSLSGLSGLACHPATAVVRG